MQTGYEGYQLSELERIAYETQNFLAQEILERCLQDPAEKTFRLGRQIKQGTHWVKEEKA